MAVFVIEWPGGSRTSFPLSSDRVTVGRSPGNGIVLSDGYVSGFHAEVRRNAEGDFELVDLASHNGTAVNGRAIKRTFLRDGDHVTFGLIEATFHLHSADLGDTQDPPPQNAAISMALRHTQGIRPHPNLVEAASHLQRSIKGQLAAQQKLDLQLSADAEAEVATANDRLEEARQQLTRIRSEVDQARLEAARMQAEEKARLEAAELEAQDAEQERELLSGEVAALQRESQQSRTLDPNHLVPPSLRERPETRRPLGPKVPLPAFLGGDLAQELEAAQLRIEQMQNQVRLLEADRGSLKARLEQVRRATEERDTVHGSLREFRAQLVDVQSSLEGAEAKRNHLEEQSGELEKQIETQLASEQELRRGVEKLTDEKSTLLEQLDEMRSELDRKSGERQHFERETQTVVERLQQVEKEEAQAREALQQALQDKQAKEDAIAQLRSQEETLKHQLAQAQDELAQTQQRAAAAEQKVSAAQQAMQSMQSSVTEAELRFKESERALRKMEGRERSMSEHLEMLKRQKQQLEKDLTAMKAELESL